MASLRLSRRTLLTLPVALVGASCSSSDATPNAPRSSDAGAPPSRPDAAVSTPEVDAAPPDASELPVPPGPGPEPSAPWAAPGVETTASFPCGVQSGDAATTSVLVNVRTTEPEIELRWVRGTATGWDDAGTKAALVPSAGVVSLEVTGLAADTTYAFAAYSKDGVKRSRVARVRTAIDAGQSRVVRFGATSCLNTPGAPFASMSKLTELGALDFFCLLGDTLYTDGISDLESAWTAQLAQKGLADVTHATSVIATWDDHEVENNWTWSSGGIQARFDAALAAFDRAIPHRAGSGKAKLWRKLTWGDALEVFVLDCRAERESGLHVSAAQMAWLKQGLTESKARFKVILSSVPMTDYSKTIIGSIKDNDRWQGYAQRSELLAHIKASAIKGVLWLSGDLHFGQIGHVSPGGDVGDDQWEVLCGPSGSNVNVTVHALPTNSQFSDLVKEWNATLFEADPATGRVRVRFIGATGNVLADRTLSLS